MLALQVPSIFSAVDQFSAPIKKMQGALNGFNNSTEKLNKRMGIAMSVAKTSAAVGLAIAAPLGLAANEAMNYEDALSSLQAITGSSNEAMKGYKSQIESVAGANKKTYTETAKLFEVIGNAKPDLLDNAAALGMVANSTMILSKAARMDLEPAAESVTTILNQYGKGAEYASKLIDVLAAGSVAGSSEIRDTSAAMKEFGTVAANAGIKVDESVALVELGSKFDKGAEAGVKFRNILLNMSSAKVLDKAAISDMQRLGVNMDIVTSTSLPLSDRLKEMSKVGKDNNAIFHIFGKENAAMATGLLNSAGSFDTFLQKVNTTGVAQKMAETNSQNLRAKIEALKNSALNLGIRIGEVLLPILTKVADAVIPVIQSVIDWTKRNPGLTDGLVKAAAAIGGVAFAISGVSLAVGFVMKIQKTWNDLTKIATGVQWAFNVALNANPISLIIIGIIALIALIAYIINKWNEWGAAVSVFLGPLGMVISLFKTFYDNWEAIKAAFKTEGIIGGLKAIGKTILDAILYPVQQLMHYLAMLPDFLGGDLAKGFESKIAAFREDNTKLSTPALNPKAIQQDSFIERQSTNNAMVDINVNNRGSGDVSAQSNSPWANIKLSSTLAHQ